MPGNSGGYAIVAKNMSIISIENLSKRYLVGHQSAERERYTALRDVIARKFKSVLRNGRDMMLGRQMIQGDEIEEFWALRDVSFEVERGDVVGIIGRNGAGKSTLLKILSRITEPTSGRITLRGRVASLLEVGTGFHPELTGRENIFLNGAILGMSRSEIKRKFDEIVDFAEVSRFLDTPVKRYSSGMYVRLAFSVAAHLESEILVIDEVLAVGDAQFQSKCMGKMADLTKTESRTLFFVSHNIGAIASLCNRAVYMQNGRVKQIGATAEVTHKYLTDGYEQGFAIRFNENDKSAGDEVVRIWNAAIVDGTGRSTGCIGIDNPIWLEVEYTIYSDQPSPRINVSFLTEDGIVAFVAIQQLQNKQVPGRYKTRLGIPASYFNAKSYILSIYASSFQPDRIHAELKDCLVLNVLDDIESPSRQSYQGVYPGALRPQFDWTTCPVEEIKFQQKA